MDEPPIADRDRRGTPGSSVDADEVARFADIAEAWWDPLGPFASLHRLNPTRIAFIRDRLAAGCGRDPLQERPLAGLSVADLGCGGGLLCEPLARLGARVTGIDPSARNIAIAENHARGAGVAVDYRQLEVETLAADNAQFDAVLAMEVIEHVADPAAFLAAAAASVRPGGALFAATLNRTAKAFAFAILGAEVLLGWVPKGSHRWSKFVRPAELIRLLGRNGIEVVEATGVSYDPLGGGWSLSRDLAVNYMIHATKLES
ncbi:MAG: bifunctional 2-polyprenyl-6-hydroxyphenol methylase/3-demethylubiquinol 3-O-methyltransferase UbiG [Alphaproteobacteria bacterium]|nr:bifunctional 2-polyprenyl-6-hydroxyphenol methylase/3-demethylubiquinol 3-O-methyltransferase UbiG [Alphaproteobacteria bacterium]